MPDKVMAALFYAAVPPGSVKGRSERQRGAVKKRSGWLCFFAAFFVQGLV